MPKSTLTDDDVELEIARIRDTDAFKLASAERRYKYRRRQMLYNYRYMEKRGNELIKLGYTLDSFSNPDPYGECSDDTDSEVS